jgi:hypothetical protein
LGKDDIGSFALKIPNSERLQVIKEEDENLKTLIYLALQLFGNS